MHFFHKIKFLLYLVFSLLLINLDLNFLKHSQIWKKKLTDDDIVHLLDIPSDSEDGFESDFDTEQIEMSDEYRDLLEEPELSTFTELILNKFPENILDEIVEFPILDHELDNGNYLNIPSSSSSEPITTPNNKKNQTNPTIHNTNLNSSYQTSYSNLKY